MQQTPMVTLITDFGQGDGYVGIMKAVMLRICKSLDIVDVSHEIPAYDVNRAAFVLGQVYAYFPHNTIHVAIVDPEVGSDRKILYVEAGNHRFLGPDNGILKYVFYREKIDRMIDVANQDYFLPDQSSTFHGRDIIAPVAAHLAGGLDPARLGPVMEASEVQLPPQPVLRFNNIRGEIIYIDHYGNLVSNISAESVAEMQQGTSDFCIHFAGSEIRELSRSFYVKRGGELLAYIDSSRFLSFAINGKNAADKMGLSIGDRVEITRG